MVQNFSLCNFTDSAAFNFKEKAEIYLSESSKKYAIFREQVKIKTG